MSGGFFFFLCILHHFRVVCACVSKLYNGAERDGERKGESGEKGQQRKYREKKKESATTGINYRRDGPTQNPLWVVKSRVGKERRGREKIGAVDHRGTVRIFSTQTQRCSPQSLCFTCHQVFILYVRIGLLLEHTLYDVKLFAYQYMSWVCTLKHTYRHFLLKYDTHLSARRGSWGSGVKGRAGRSGTREQLWPPAGLRSAGSTPTSSAHRHDKT